MEGDITRILDELGRDAPGAEEALLERVYDELKGLAETQMRRERQGHTLQPTALVHEAYLRLLGDKDASFEDRAHFFGAAARVMRRILVDIARARATQKRGGDRVRVTWDGAASSGAPSAEDVLAIHDALEKLERADPSLSRVVELRFFAGLTGDETAAVMGLSRRRVVAQWELARAWLFREFSP